jgi:hypothetical protein
MILKRRIEPGRGFTVLQNKVFEDERLSLEAMGLLAWLRSKPKDWTINFAVVRKRFEIGRDKAYKLVSELVDTGWIVKEWVREEGTFQKVEYIVLDEPQHHIQESIPFPETAETVSGAEECSPFPSLPDTAKPYTANQEAVINKDSIINTHPNPPAGRGKFFIRFGLKNANLELACRTIATVQATDAAGTHQAVEAALDAAGFVIEREAIVSDRGDGRSGRIDLLAELDGDELGIELDREVIRQKSRRAGPARWFSSARRLAAGRGLDPRRVGRPQGDALEILPGAPRRWLVLPERVAAARPARGTRSRTCGAAGDAVIRAR